VNGDSIYNGALDKRVGYGGYARHGEAFVRTGVRTPRSLIFMAFAAEESGCSASTAYAARPTVPLKNIAAVLNMDVHESLRADKGHAALGHGPVVVGQGLHRGRQAGRAPGHRQ